MPRPGASYRLRLPARSSAVPPARALLKGLLQEAGYPEAFAEDMELALDEALHNTIEHTYRFKPGREIEVLFEPGERSFRMSIQDWGPAFDSKKIPAVDMDRYVREKKEGGLGVLLMRRLMDKVSYRHGSKTGNLLVLEKGLEYEGFHKRLRAPLKKAQLEALRRGLARECEAKALPKGYRALLLSVADEACTNVMGHSGANWLEASFRLSEGKAVLTLRDDGRAFDPVEAASFMDEPLVDEKVDRHLGLYMLSRHLKDLAYRRVDGVNELSFSREMGDLEKP